MRTLLRGCITHDVHGEAQALLGEGQALLGNSAKEIFHGCPGRCVWTTDTFVQFQGIDSVTNSPIVEYALTLVSRSFSCLLSSELLLILRSDRHASNRRVLIQLSLDLSELHDVLDYVDLVHVLFSTRCHDALSASQLKAAAEAALREVIMNELSERRRLVQRLELFAFEAILSPITAYRFIFSYRLRR